MKQLPFLPAGNLPPLQKAAKASAQMGRLLDALLILDVEGTCRVADLALRVGLPEQRLRDLLSSYMVAGADAVGTAAPFTITFDTEAGPLSADPEHDDAQARADVVYVSDTHTGVPLLDDLGRRAVTVEEVTRALLSARALLVSDELDPRHRPLVDALAAKLEAAMQVTVTAPVDAVVARLRAAVSARHPVAFRYRDPWTGQATRPMLEPYDVRRRRDRFLLDAGTSGGQFWTFDISAISDLQVEVSATFPERVLPPVEERERPIRVVIRVPKDSAAERRLEDGWAARVVGPAPDGQLDLTIELDRVNAAARLGVLVLQLGAPCAVLEPAELAGAAVPVAQRLLDGLAR